MKDMNIKEQKQTVRKQMLAMRNALAPELKADYDRSLREKTMQLIRERGCKTLHCYLPMGSEVDLFPLLAECLKAGLRVLCPKTLPKRRLENLLLTSLDELEPGVMGTAYPANAEVYHGDYDLIIVPGLAFDADCYRLGYGGGYYDAFLAEHPEAYKIGLFYPFQQVAELPREAHDFKMDAVLLPD